MSFQDAVRVCLTEKFATFSGRARRSEYWFFMLFYAGVLVVCVLLSNLTLGPDREGNFFTFVLILPFIAIILPAIAVTVRRLHDTNRPGVYYLLNLIPFGIGSIVLLVFTVEHGTMNPNQYGPDPKQIQAI